MTQEPLFRIRAARRPFGVAGAILGIPTVLGLVATAKDVSAWQAVVVFGGGLLLSYAWLWRLELAVNNDQITYQTLFSTTKIRFADIGSIRYEYFRGLGRPRTAARWVLSPKAHCPGGPVVVRPRLFDADELAEVLGVIEGKAGIRVEDA
jgi:hypothetical protein